MTAGNAINLLLSRLRDPGAIAHTRPMMLQLLGHARRILNIKTGFVVATTPFQLFARQQFYPIDLTANPYLGRIVSVRDGNRELDFCQFNHIKHSAGRRWSREVGTRPELWSTLGRTFLIVHPALPHDSLVYIVFTLLLNDFISEDDELGMEDPDADSVLDLTEALILLRDRKIESGTSPIQRISQRGASGRA